MILVLTANIVLAATVFTAVIGLLTWSTRTEQTSTRLMGRAGHLAGTGLAHHLDQIQTGAGAR